MTYARSERQALASTLRDVGPDAPTMCDGWTARDLAAHIVVRESRLDAAPGIAVPALAGYTEKVQAKVAAGEWTSLIDRVAGGPPWFSPFRPLDRWLNLSEMFVHHEDVLRGGVDPTSDWSPRVIDPALQKALVGAVRSAVRVAMPKLPVRVTLRTPDGVAVTSAGSGDAVTVTGTAGELLLFTFGREPVQVTLHGTDAAVAALKSAPRGV
ncbi:TIGR03085 family metal-binding protein [Gordonia sp. CPCC 205333]|uniref:TIGR03085 family metal-binding protein n=1 Tax=Gordonia sp. CPCC 205333 TaxID=3140790 RepID=UPI003AF3DA26